MTAITRAGRRALRRMFASAEDQDRSVRRAGSGSVPVAMVTPRTWIALA